MLNLLVALALNLHAEPFITHRAFCAGLLNPRAGRVLDSVGGGDYARNGNYEALYVIDGRPRRVTFGTQRSFVEGTRLIDEPLPTDRLEVPMVSERLPLISREILPYLRNLWSSHFARAVRAVFSDPRRPALDVSEANGVTRFTLEVANGAAVNVADLRLIAARMGAHGFGEGDVRTTEPGRVRVVIGRLKFTGPEFYAHLREVERGEARPSRVTKLGRFLMGLDLRRAVRNAFRGPEGKVGFRPRYAFGTAPHGDLTPELMTRVASELRTRHADPRDYDVVVGEREFTGKEFAEVHLRMVREGVVSINAERRFDQSGAGFLAASVADGWTLQLRLAGVLSLGALAVPDASLTTQTVAVAGLGFVTLSTLTGSLINRAWEARGTGPVTKVFRRLAYLLPNYSGLFDSANYYGVRAVRDRVLVDNVEEALTRHDVNEIVIITDGSRDVARLRRAFDARFGHDLNVTEVPILAASRVALATNLGLRAQVARLDATFAPREFANVDEVRAYFDPRRVAGFAAESADPREVALVAHHLLKGLRAGVPYVDEIEPRHWARLFAPYELVGAGPLGFRALRRSAAHEGP